MFDLNSLLAASGLMVAGIVWLIRLEGKVNQSERAAIATQDDVDDLRKRYQDDVNDLRRRHEALDEKWFTKLSEIEKSLARIEGRLQHEGPRT